MNFTVAFRNDVTSHQHRFQVITTAEELNTLYTESLTNSSCTECEWDTLEAVDFSTSTVVFVAHEIVGSGGYSIHIDDVYQAGAGFIVDVVKTNPGDSCIATDAFTAPYKLYKLTGNVGNIDVVERVAQDRAC